MKLYFEILDDPKMGRLPDWLWRRAIELFLLAGENGNDGLLQPVSDMGWRLRTSEDDLVKSLLALSQIGVVHETPEGWVVTHFKERQFSDSAERMRRFREKSRNSDGNSDAPSDGNVPSSSSSISSSGSSEEGGGVGEETAVKMFVDYFGKFHGERELSRWTTLYEAVGKDRATDLADWAIKKEIHLSNRGGLLDSIETAAKNWKEKATPKNGANYAKRKPTPTRSGKPTDAEDAASRKLAEQIKAERAAKQQARV
jgi:hypothetical protein